MQRKAIFVGVDVSKSWLDIYIRDEKLHVQITNNSEGFKQLLSFLKVHYVVLSDCWFVLEFTGGYEYRFVQFCQSRKVRFTRVAGLEIKRSLGMQRDKNDKIDSRRISEYGYEKQYKLKAEKSRNAAIVRLKQLLTQRRSFVKDRKAHEHRLKEFIVMMDVKKTDVILKSYEQVINLLKNLIAKTEKEIEKLIQIDEMMNRNFQLITSIPGIGNVNGWMTIAYTDNFESFSTARQYGAYCGVVPFDYSSGVSIRGKSRVSHLANKLIKSDLDMAARASVQHDDEMKEYYQRRASVGKHHMSIMNEVKFKLVLRMFAVVNKGEFYVKKLKNIA